MSRRRKILVAVLAGVAGLLAVNTVLTDNQTAAARVSVPGARMLRLAGGDLQVLDVGPRNASPIVLIHGDACAIDWWQRVIPLLDRSHRVVAIDLLGFGGSAKPRLRILDRQSGSTQSLREELMSLPVIGEAMWPMKPRFRVANGLSQRTEQLGPSPRAAACRSGRGCEDPGCVPVRRSPRAGVPAGGHARRPFGRSLHHAAVRAVRGPVHRDLV